MKAKDLAEIGIAEGLIEAAAVNKMSSARKRQE